jgi:hypothetical protein
VGSIARWTNGGFQGGVEIPSEAPSVTWQCMLGTNLQFSADKLLFFSSFSPSFSIHPPNYPLQFYFPLNLIYVFLIIIFYI